MNKLYDVVEILKVAGWKDNCDAQWVGIEAALPELAALLSCNSSAEQAQAEPVAWKPGKRPPSVFKTSEAGRQYVADFFANALRRHDFSSYIKGHLAADFACALSDGLHAMQQAQQAEHIVEATEMVQQDEPVSAQCRFEGEEEWNPCTIAHHLLVQAHPKEWPHYETRALYAQPPAVAGDVPDGYALVPVEPTDGMLSAGQQAWLNSAGADPSFDVYRAMLAVQKGGA